MIEIIGVWGGGGKARYSLNKLQNGPLESFGVWVIYTIYAYEDTMDIFELILVTCNLLSKVITWMHFSTQMAFVRWSFWVIFSFLIV